VVAAVFLYIPFTIASRRKQDLAGYGFTLRPIGRNLLFGVVGPMVVFPLFLGGFVLYYQHVCAHGPAILAPPGWCARFLGAGAVEHPRLPTDFLNLAATQLIVVAIPEELFFRGYLLKRLEEAFPPRRRLLGGGIGIALVISAAMFALGHVLVDLDPLRFAVFFPGLLFGWMRSATGSIAPGAFVHASSNLYMELLQRTFFR
jgi:membrane protease YdiL (CAAX protease family)